ncbi:MAG: phosphate/phosphite/phosphonate ABC transporter substrate-binding protein [Elusimicrobia bacterium]|nr:phosphate/phosphite/phosphonate ABC transporter substrate-binding protein [Elusimicrobiota bacterium]
MTTKAARTVCLAAMGLLSCAWPVFGETYSFGVVPQENLAVLSRLWLPLLDVLAQKTGVKIQFETAPSIEEFNARCRQGRYDFIYVNPYVYVQDGRAAGYAAFAREAGRMHGILVVARKSPIRRVADLKGKRIAFPDPQSFGGTFLNKQLLKASGLDLERDVSVSYLSSHDDAYQAVLNGLSDAAGGVPRTFGLLPPQARARLRVLARTPGVTTLPFAAQRRVPAAAVESVARALTGLADDERGRKLLEAVGIKRIVRAADADWDDVRRLAAGGFAR